MTIPPGKEEHNKIATTRLPWQDSQDKRATAGQPWQNSRDRTATAGRPRQDIGVLYFSQKTIFIPPPPFLKMILFPPSPDTSFFDSHPGCFALILPYFAIILPFYFPFSHFLPLYSFFFPLSSFFFYIFPFLSLPFHIHSPKWHQLISPPRGIFQYIDPWKDSNSRTAMERQLCQDSYARTAVTGQPWQDSRDRTAETGQPWQDSRDRTAVTGQPWQDSLCGKNPITQAKFMWRITQAKISGHCPFSFIKISGLSPFILGMLKNISSDISALNIKIFQALYLRIFQHLIQ